MEEDRRVCPKENSVKHGTSVSSRKAMPNDELAFLYVQPSPSTAPHLISPGRPVLRRDEDA